MPQALITSNPRIMLGKPTVAGTRIRVELILEKLAAGETMEQILSEHSRLTEQGIRAAIAFAEVEAPAPRPQATTDDDFIELLPV